MWIRTTLGEYLNVDNLFKLQITELKSGDFAITANSIADAYATLAIFRSREDAQKYLDRMMKAFGEKIFEVSMEDWNYAGHAKTTKTKGHGGS